MNSEVNYSNETFVDRFISSLTISKAIEGAQVYEILLKSGKLDSVFSSVGVDEVDLSIMWEDIASCAIEE